MIDGSTVREVLGAALHRSLEHVHTSAAPFLRHLLVPSNQHPRNRTTEIKEMKNRQYNVQKLILWVIFFPTPLLRDQI